MSERGSPNLYGAAIQQLRETSKWIVAAAAGIAALALGGSALTGLGSLRPGARLWLAIIAGVVGLLGVAVVVWFSVRVLRGDTLTISEVASKPEYERHRKTIEKRIGHMFPKPEGSQSFGWHSLNEAFLLKCEQQRRSSSPKEKAEGTDGLDLVMEILRNVALIQTTERFDTLCFILIIIFPILILSIGTFAWAVNPSKDIGKEFNRPIVQTPVLNDRDKELLAKAGVGSSCLSQRTRVLVLRERAARMADGILLTDSCQPLRIMLSRDGHISDTGSRD